MAPQIVIGVDGSETSLDALAAGADLAQQTGSQLSVVFVRDPGLAGSGGASTGEQEPTELAFIAREHVSDALRDKLIEWTFDTATGDITHELENVAQRRDAALIIVGGHHRAAPGVASVAERLVRDLPVPVLVVGQRPPGRPAPSRRPMRTGRKPRNTTSSGSSPVVISTTRGPTEEKRRSFDGRDSRGRSGRDS
jgi:nucleotide-binding universal stress UspA family protein